ncbi:MAG: aminomethyl-transferring glycine dehydrogenase subunit GcvPA [Deltaproteobacteria bacterium]
MRYLPHTKEDIATMLEVVGAKSLDDLFATIPDDCRLQDALKLPSPLSEWDLNSFMDGLASTMSASSNGKVFVGAGSYEHHIPATLPYLLSRSEFSTAYTPYQPEISQGTLQAIYEYQTMVSRLLGMEVANASLYDGASALAEAVLMAMRITKRQKIAISKALHPHHAQVLRTYLTATDCELIELPYLKNGKTDYAQSAEIENLAGVVVQSPNFFGCIEDISQISDIAHTQGALAIVSFTEPFAYGLLKNPGICGADIVCGEGQSFGIPRSFGGPGLGMFATKMKFVRSMPGRLVGKTTDTDGRRGFVLTLSTREQHIRREKATSNICTNSGLCALTSAMYMALLGATGLSEMAQLNYDKTEYLKNALQQAGVKIPFDSPTFNEFVAEFPAGFEKTYQQLLAKNIVAGLPLATYYPELPNHYLFCVTETMSKETIDILVQEVKP